VAANGGGVGVGVAVTGVSVGLAGVGGVVVPKRAPQADRLSARTSIKFMVRKRGGENIATIIPIKHNRGDLLGRPYERSI